MKDRFFSFLCFLGRLILSLRYRVKVEGKELLDKNHLNKKGGVLILPNHPGHMDPIFIVLHLWPILKMRPLVIEYMYRKRFLTFFMDLVKAIPIPDFESSISDLKIEKGEEVINKIEKGLKRKESFLLYPSGKLKHTGKEIIGGASATHDLIQRCPETNVVLIRTIGLWGSRFSRAITGKSPDFKKNFFKGIWIVLKNFIFLTPRRKVHIQIAPNPVDFPWTANRLELNRYLENWYNQYPSHKEKGLLLDIEPLVLVSSSFFRKTYPQLLEVKKFQKKRYAGKISPKKKKEIYKFLTTLSEMQEDEIEEEMNLSLDLGLDSLDIANIVAFLSDHYDTGNIHPEDLDSVQDILEIAEGRLKGVRQEELSSKLKWPDEKKRPFPKMPQGKTIQESFLQCCFEMKNHAACTDDLTGAMSYKKLKRTVLVLANEFKKIPGKYLGIMLPASTAAYVSILACLMANKVPVMLNWTLGPRYLNEMMKIAKAKKVISSWRFLEKLSHVEFGDVKKDVVYLEDLRKKISLKAKLKGLFASFKSVDKILKQYKIKYEEDNEAVILFTSGTESVPKAVPLTHKNILSNQQAAMQCVILKPKDILYGILPPFHSFGFSVAGIFPILAGLRVAFYPDPTDSYALVAGVKRWQITMFCGAPSFINGLLQAGTEKELKNIRLFITGAEKAPKTLFQKVHNLGKNNVVIEGYGITECSPIISLTRPNQKRVGVGQLIPGLEAMTIHPETLEPLEKGENGEICVRGPSIFSGYLGKKKSPFITIDKKKWYRTGDLGKVDESNNIILSGRLKRFAKIGGEMISLGGLEEVITHKTVSQKEQEEGPQLAVCVDESEETKSTLILFATFDLDRKAVNQLLKQEGFSSLVKIHKVQVIDEIPLLGTGKTDYRKLQSMI